MKKYLILLLTISIAFAINSSLAELYLNDAPVWGDFPSESIDEDCENGFGKQVEQTSTRLLHIKIRALESALEKLRQKTNE